MKKIILLLTISITFIGCDLMFDQVQEGAVCGKDLYYGDFPEMDTFEDVADYVSCHIQYRKDGITTPVAGPRESLTRGYGDCDEFSIAFMNVAYYTLCVKFEFVSLFIDSDYTGNRSIGTGGMVNHALVRLNGVVYSAYNGMVCPELEAAYYYSFDEVFK